MCNELQYAFIHSLNKLCSNDQIPISLIIENQLNETISSGSSWETASSIGIDPSSANGLKCFILSVDLKRFKYNNNNFGRKSSFFIFF